MKLLGTVLQTQRFRETDLMVNLLTEERGRISCIARGAQKSKHRFAGGIDLWDSGYFELEPCRPRGALSIESISQLERWPRLREDLLRFTFAGFISELLLRLTEEDQPEDGGLCRPFLKALKYLSSSTAGREQASIAAYFSFLLFRELGYDLAENEERLEGRAALRDWIKMMAETEKPILPYGFTILQEAYVVLCRGAEEIIGRELRSKKSVEEALLGLLPRDRPA